jgi:putative endonuclease
MKNGYVYIMASKKNGVLYIGVTSNLAQRIRQHKNWLIDGFTKKYFVKKLVYYEEYWSISDAIQREKELKWLVRSKKVTLISAENPEWNDLANEM